MDKIIKFIRGIWYRVTGKTITKQRNVIRAKVLYWYVICGSVFNLAYFGVSLFFEVLPWYYCLSPWVLLSVGFIGYILKKNARLIWIFISDIEQGRLLMVLNRRTHWEMHFKLRVLNWVYLKKGTIRNETQLPIRDKVMRGVQLADEEKELLRFKPVVCPQQIKIGFNEALLVACLIDAHENIKVLDQDLRDIMNLTDENMLAFDLQEEVRKAEDSKYAHKLEVGRRTAKKLQKEGKL